MATAAEFDALLTIALREATELTTMLVQQHGIDQLAGWSLDETKGQLLFAGVNRQAALMAAQVVGTYQPAKRRFEWAWNDLSFHAPITRAAKESRGWGTVNEMKLLTDPVHEIDDTTAWKLAAFTARLIDWPGIYRGTGGPAEIFLAFTPIPEAGPKLITPATAFALPNSMNG